MQRNRTRVALVVLVLAFVASCEFYMPDSRSFKHAKWDETKGQYVTEENRGD